MNGRTKMRNHLRFKQHWDKLIRIFITLVLVFPNFIGVGTAFAIDTTDGNPVYQEFGETLTGGLGRPREEASWYVQPAGATYPQPNVVNHRGNQGIGSPNFFSPSTTHEGLNSDFGNEYIRHAIAGSNPAHESFAIRQFARETATPGLFDVITNIRGNAPLTIQPIEIILVADHSSSMSANVATNLSRLQILNEAVRKIVTELHGRVPSQKIYIGHISYGTTINSGTKVDLGDINDVAQKNKLLGINRVTEGYTFTQAGLRYASQMFTNTAGRDRMIILLTDGVPSVSNVITGASRTTGQTGINNFTVTGTTYGNKPTTDQTGPTRNWDTSRFVTPTGQGRTSSGDFGARYVKNTSNNTDNTNYQYDNNFLATIFEAQKIRAGLVRNDSGVFEQRAPITIEGVGIGIRETTSGSYGFSETEIKNKFGQIATAGRFRNLPDGNLQSIYDAILSPILENSSTVRNGSFVNTLGQGFILEGTPSVSMYRDGARIDYYASTEVAADRRNFTLSNLTLGVGREVQITHQVRINTEMEGFLPEHWYFISDPNATRFQPTLASGTVPFAVPAGKAPGVEIELTKVWQDNHEPESTRPARPNYVTFELGRNTNTAGAWSRKEQVPTAQGDTWTTTVGKLPKFNNQGVDFEYYVVREVDASSDYYVTINGTTVTNRLNPRYTFYKRDALTDRALVDVEFKLFTDVNAAPIAIGRTREGGRLWFNNNGEYEDFIRLATGTTYTMVETVSEDSLLNFEAPARPWTFVAGQAGLTNEPNSPLDSLTYIDGSNTYEVRVVNYRTNPLLRLRKYNYNVPGQALDGASFTIERNNSTEPLRTAVSANGGYVNFGDDFRFAKNSTYTLTETIPAPGFQIPEVNSWTITVDYRGDVKMGEYAGVNSYFRLRHNTLIVSVDNKRIETDLRIVKLDGDASARKPLGEVDFTLTPVDAVGQVIGEAIPAINNNGTVTFPNFVFNTVGRYRLDETNNTGWQAAGPWYFEVREDGSIYKDGVAQTTGTGNTRTLTIDITNYREPVFFNIVKQNELGVMPSVQFTLERLDEEADGIELSTDLEGRISFGDLPIGSQFRLTETVPTGFKQAGPWIVTVERNGDIQFVEEGNTNSTPTLTFADRLEQENSNLFEQTIINERIPTNFTIQKNFQYGAGEVATFILSQEGTEVARGTSNEQGLVTFTNDFQFLLPGVYQLSELAIDGFQPAGPWTVTVAQDGAVSISGNPVASYNFTRGATTNSFEVTIDNQRVANNLEIIKIDEATGERLDGVTFTLTGPGITTPLVSSQNATTGHYYFPGFSFVAPGVYTLTETATAPGYVLPGENTWTFTVGTDGSVTSSTHLADRLPANSHGETLFVTIDNSRAIQDLEITKIDFYTREVMANVGFTVSFGGNTSEVFYTDEDGILVLPIQRAGDYTITENVPAGFQEVGPWVISIDEAGNVTSDDFELNENTPYSFAVTIENVRIPPTLNILKVDDLGIALAGIPFTLVEQPNANNPIVGATPQATVTAVDGSMNFTLSIGSTYLLREARPDAYAPAGPWLVEVALNGTVTMTDQSGINSLRYWTINAENTFGVTIINQRELVNLRVLSVDENFDTPLPNTSFNLQRVGATDPTTIAHNEVVSLDMNSVYSLTIADIEDGFTAKMHTWTITTPAVIDRLAHPHGVSAAVTELGGTSLPLTAQDRFSVRHTPGTINESLIPLGIRALPNTHHLTEIEFSVFHGITHDLTLEKVDGHDQVTPLEAEFELSRFNQEVEGTNVLGNVIDFGNMTEVANEFTDVEEFVSTDGTLSLEGLTRGVLYKLVETGEPTGYVLSDVAILVYMDQAQVAHVRFARVSQEDETILEILNENPAEVLNSAEGVLTFANFRLQTALDIVKTDAHTGEPKPGVEFTLTNPNRDVVASAQTDDEGLISFGNVFDIAGKYILTETDVPGFVNSGPWTLVVAENGDIYLNDVKVPFVDGQRLIKLEIENEREVSSFNLTKLDATSNVPRPGVKFTLERIGTDEVWTGISGADGSVVFSSDEVEGLFTFAVGASYKLTETRPDGYDPAGPWRISVDNTTGMISMANYNANDTRQDFTANDVLSGVEFVVTIRNYRTITNLELIKLDGNASQRTTLEGFEFTLTLVDEDNVAIPGFELFSGTSDEDGVVTFDNDFVFAAKARYRLDEVGQEGWQERGPWFFTMEESGDITFDGDILDVETRDGVRYVSVDIVNEREEIYFSLTKQNAQGIMVGVEFTLERLDVTAQDFSDVTDQQGQLTFGALPIGSTWLLSETIPTGYYGAGPWIVEITNTGNVSFRVQGSQTVLVSDDFPVAENTFTVTINNERIPTRFVLRKTDAFGTNLVGARFVLTRNIDNQVVAEATSDEEGLVDFGNFLFTNPGGYTLTEYEPAGFYSAGSWAVTVGLDGALSIDGNNLTSQDFTRGAELNTFDVTIRNYRIQPRLNLLKTDNEGNELDNVTFELVQVDTGEVVQTGTTNTDGMVEWEDTDFTLAIGVNYELRETRTQEGFLTAGPWMIEVSTEGVVTMRDVNGYDSFREWTINAPFSFGATIMNQRAELLALQIQNIDADFAHGLAATFTLSTRSPFAQYEEEDTSAITLVAGNQGFLVPQENPSAQAIDLAFGTEYFLTLIDLPDGFTKQTHVWHIATPEQLENTDEPAPVWQARTFASFAESLPNTFGITAHLRYGLGHVYASQAIRHLNAENDSFNVTRVLGTGNRTALLSRALTPIVENQTLVEFSIYHNIEHDFTIHKVSGTNNATPLIATFELSAFTGKVEGTDVIGNVVGFDTTMQEVVNEFEKVSEFTTLADGRWTLPNLRRGVLYKIEETVAPEGYQLPAVVIMVYMDEEQNPHFRYATISEDGQTFALLTEKPIYHVEIGAEVVNVDLRFANFPIKGTDPEDPTDPETPEGPDTPEVETPTPPTPEPTDPPILGTDPVDPNLPLTGTSPPTSVNVGGAAGDELPTTGTPPRGGFLPITGGAESDFLLVGVLLVIGSAVAIYRNKSKKKQ